MDGDGGKLMDGDGGLQNDFNGGDYKMALMDRCFVATQGDDVRVKALVGCFNKNREHGEKWNSRTEKHKLEVLDKHMLEVSANEIYD